jgi:hypothetical protein
MSSVVDLSSAHDRQMIGSFYVLLVVGSVTSLMTDGYDIVAAILAGLMLIFGDRVTNRDCGKPL